MRIKPLLPVMPSRMVPGTAPKPAVAKMAKPVLPKASKPKRPSGQFAGKAEALGKANGAGYADAQHPQSHEAFEKL